MKMKILSAVLLAVCAPAAFAQVTPPTPPTASGSGTCADPYTPDVSLTAYSGSTCGGEIGINMGGVILGHPSMVFSFVYNDVDDATEPDLIQVTGTNMNVIVAPDCATAPIGGAAEGIPFNLDTTSGLVDGQTYVVAVTTDPSVPVTDPPTCGNFTMTNDTLPVELQGMSVE